MDVIQVEKKEGGIDFYGIFKDADISCRADKPRSIPRNSASTPLGEIGAVNQMQLIKSLKIQDSDKGYLNQSSSDNSRAFSVSCSLRNFVIYSRYTGPKKASNSQGTNWIYIFQMGGDKSCTAQILQNPFMKFPITLPLKPVSVGIGSGSRPDVGVSITCMQADEQTGLVFLGTNAGQLLVWNFFKSGSVGEFSSRTNQLKVIHDAHYKAISCMKLTRLSTCSISKNSGKQLKSSFLSHNYRGGSGMYLCTGSDDSVVHLWCISSLKNLFDDKIDSDVSGLLKEHRRRKCKPYLSLSQHTMPVTAVEAPEFSHSSNRLITASLDKTCKLWHIPNFLQFSGGVYGIGRQQSANCLLTIIYPVPIHSLSIDCNFANIVVGGSDGCIYLSGLYERAMDGEFKFTTDESAKGKSIEFSEITPQSDTNRNSEFLRRKYLQSSIPSPESSLGAVRNLKWLILQSLTLKSARKPFESGNFSNPSQFLISSYELSDKIFIWDVNTGQLVRSVECGSLVDGFNLVPRPAGTYAEKLFQIGMQISTRESESLTSSTAYDKSRSNQLAGSKRRKVGDQRAALSRNKNAAKMMPLLPENSIAKLNGHVEVSNDDDSYYMVKRSINDESLIIDI